MRLIGDLDMSGFNEMVEESLLRVDSRENEIRERETVCSQFFFQRSIYKS